MAIPSFDLIVTGAYNENSNILIFNKPSITIFKNDSIFEKLLKLLSNPIINTDLGKAIKISFELKRMKKKRKRKLSIYIN